MLATLYKLVKASTYALFVDVRTVYFGRWYGENIDRLVADIVLTKRAPNTALEPITLYSIAVFSGNSKPQTGVRAGIWGYDKV